jgi:hypothetical protein
MVDLNTQNIHNPTLYQTPIMNASKTWITVWTAARQ